MSIPGWPCHTTRSLMSLCAAALLLGAAPEGLTPLAAAQGFARQTAAHTQPTSVTLHFDSDVPPHVEVSLLVRAPSARGWQVASVSEGRIVERMLAVEGQPTVETLLLIKAPGMAGYLLDGPFRWPIQPAGRWVAPVWRHTITGTGTQKVPLTWVPGIRAGAGDAWPQCHWAGSREWECIGVPVATPGVVLLQDHPLTYALVPAALPPGGAAYPAIASSAWGRLLLVDGADQPVEDPVVRIRKTEGPRARPRSLRLDAVADDTVAVSRLGGGAFWLAGSGASDHSWIEVRGRHRRTVRLGLLDAAAGPPELPLAVELEPARPLEGRVLDADGREAAGANVKLWRLLPPEGKSREPRRVFAGESTTDAAGGFRLDDPGDAFHELVALHPSGGRATLRPDPTERTVEIRLARPSLVVGQVTQEGIPASGVPVRVVPDLLRAAGSTDLAEMLGGESATDRSGRFRVLAPARGPSEVRIGAGNAIRRVPLGPAESLPPIVDLGVVSLDAAIVLWLVLEASDGCDLLLTGPLGHSGPTVVRSMRLGPAMFEAQLPERGRWLTSAVCGRSTRAVNPPFVDVADAVPGGTVSTVPLSWR